MRQLQMMTALIWLTAVLTGSGAKALTLTAAAKMISPSVVFLEVKYIDCESQLAKTDTGTAVAITKAGDLVSSAHLFRTDGCSHRITSIRAWQVRETAATADAPLPLSVRLSGAPDLSTDLAALKIDGPIPPDLTPAFICTNFSPQSGEYLYAFGYPRGKPLTPLTLTYSHSDVSTHFWITSGLTTEGMSGGPVLDEHGNVVGLVQGGLLDANGHVYAVRYVAPLRAFAAPGLELKRNCGLFKVGRVQSPNDDLSVIRQDQNNDCGFRVVPGFKTVYLQKNGSRSDLKLIPDPVGIAAHPGLEGLVAASFSITARRLELPQFGVKSGSFEAAKDVMDCAAASRYRPDNNDFNGVTVLSDAFKATKSSDQLTLRSDEECVAGSQWLSAEMGGHGETTSDVVGYPVERAAFGKSSTTGLQLEQIKLHYTQYDHKYIGLLLFFDIDRSINTIAEARPELSRRDVYKLIFDSQSNMRLRGSSITCFANDNISFADFRQICTATVARAVVLSGNQAGQCLGYWLLNN